MLISLSSPEYAGFSYVLCDDTFCISFEIYVKSWYVWLVFLCCASSRYPSGIISIVFYFGAGLIDLCTRGLSPQRFRFDPRPDYIDFDRQALEQSFSQYFEFCLGGAVG